jgi:hypothetical protein
VTGDDLGHSEDRLLEGERVFVGVVLNEETVRLTRKDQAAEIWRRCKPTS